MFVNSVVYFICSSLIKTTTKRYDKNRVFFNYNYTINYNYCIQPTSDDHLATGLTIIESSMYFLKSLKCNIQMSIVKGYADLFIRFIHHQSHSLSDCNQFTNIKL